MELAWGKNRHWLNKLTNGEPSETYIEIPTPADGTFQLNPTKGDKKEAIIEGGDVEAVKYNKNKHAVEFEIRQGNEDGTPRKKPIEDEDGVIPGEYRYINQPENPDVEGIVIDRCVVSCEDSLNMTDGGRWKYTIDALKPKTGNQVKWRKITVANDKPTVVEPTTGTGS